MIRLLRALPAKGRRRAIGLIALGALLSACAGRIESHISQGSVTAEANIFPQNYKNEILAFLRSYLNDPTRIRAAFISEPELKPAGPDKRYGVCLRFNARNSAGQYEGSKDRVVYFLSGRLDTMVDDKFEHCGKAAFKPFPELERLTR